ATLPLPVPPMMLQTLVENAIKHGISRQVSGGTVRIISRAADGCHQIIVQNTGRLKKVEGGDGFGLPGTRSRLYLMFGDKAAFTIQEVNGSMVEATIRLPADPGAETGSKRKQQPDRPHGAATTR